MVARLGPRGGRVPKRGFGSILCGPSVVHLAIHLYVGSITGPCCPSSLWLTWSCRATKRQQVPMMNDLLRYAWVSLYRSPIFVPYYHHCRKREGKKRQVKMQYIRWLHRDLELLMRNVSLDVREKQPCSLSIPTHLISKKRARLRTFSGKMLQIERI